MCLEDMVEAAGGKVVRVRVGDAYITEEMEKRKAIFGGEPIGAWVIPEVHMCPDGILSALKLLEALEERDQTLSQFVSEAPEYPTRSAKIEVKDRVKAMKDVEQGYRKAFGEAVVNRVDGLRFQLPEGWILIRASGTEPLIRLTAEGRDEKATTSLLERGRELVKEATKVKAVIIAAGKAERLRPLTSTKPKQLIPIGGRPQLEWLIKGVAEAGIKDILIVTHYMEEKIKHQFNDGSDLGVRLSYTRQREMRGTADAFRYAEDFAADEDFIGMNGDLYLSPGIFKEIVKDHKEGELTVAGLERDPYLYGALKLQGDRVQGIIEKPAPGTAPSNVTNAGIYVFPPGIFDAIQATKLSPRGEYEVTDSVNNLIASGSLCTRPHAR